MNTTVIMRNWNKQKNKLKERFAIPADNNLLSEEDKKVEMLSILRIKSGMTKEELQELIQAL